MLRRIREDGPSHSVIKLRQQRGDHVNVGSAVLIENSYRLGREKCLIVPSLQPCCGNQEDRVRVIRGRFKISNHSSLNGLGVVDHRKHGTFQTTELFYIDS